ncbi:MAG TPA: energy transducer TonB [Terriglobales bacterium]|nr:energy transducer TonB [Terriglobales bacterium]
MMVRRVGVLLYVILAMTAAAPAQEPSLVSANIPKYPGVALVAHIEGTVRLTITLEGNSTEPTNIQVISGHPLLNAMTIENLRSWRFENRYAVARNYEITFEYRLTRDSSVCFESSRKVTVFGHSLPSLPSD